jgi:hypothetical protein
MPLKKSSSKKAFEHNLKAELHAGKPKDQSLAIAYSIKRKAKKAKGGGVHQEDTPMGKGVSAAGYHARSAKEMADKYGATDSAPLNVAKQAHREKLAELKAMPKVPKYADGGEISAKDEKRPNPNDLYNDAKQAHQSEARKPLKNSDWTDNPTVKQAQANNSRKVMPISRPKMVPTNAFSTKLYNQEGQLEDSMPPSSPKDQPDQDYNEMGAKRQGPKVPDMAHQHNNGKAPYKEEIEDQYSQDEAESDMKQYAKGGKVKGTLGNSIGRADYGPEHSYVSAGKDIVVHHHPTGKSVRIPGEHLEQDHKDASKLTHDEANKVIGSYIPLKKAKGGTVDKSQASAIADADKRVREMHKRNKGAKNDIDTGDSPDYGLHIDHVLNRKSRYAKGGDVTRGQELDKGLKGEINKLISFSQAEEDGLEHPAHEEEDNDQMRPDMKEYMSGRMPAYADGGILGDAEDTLDPSVPLGKMAGIKLADGGILGDAEDTLDPSVPLGKMAGIKLAKGGLAYEEDMQPQDEEEMEHHDSIAAAIMAKRDRLHAHIDSGAMDEDSSFPSEDHPELDQDMYALGGEINEDGDSILSKDSIYPSRSSQADLSRNHDEDANMEDQSSFNALRKENYNSSNLDKDQPEDSNMKGDEREAARSDKHDMIAKIRAKRSKRQFNWE